MKGSDDIVRIRLKFEDPFMLTSQQRAEGLKQSWMIVKPHLKTVAELVSDIKFAFQLHGTCPHGILLSMEGFILPPSQSIWIIKDKDIISVTRKRDPSGKEIFSEDGANNTCFTLDGLMLPGGVVKLRAMDEFEKETGGYQSEYEDDGTDFKEKGGVRWEKLSTVKDWSGKKRKRSYQIQSVRAKKSTIDNEGEILHGTVEIRDDEHIHKKQKSGKHLKGTKCSSKVQNNIGDNEMNEPVMEEVSNSQPKEQELLSHKKVKDKEAKQLKATKKSVKIQHEDQMIEGCSKRVNNIATDNQGNSLHGVAIIGDDEHIHKKQKNGKHLKETNRRDGVQNKDRAMNMNEFDMENGVNKMKECDLENHNSLQSKQQEHELLVQKKVKDKKAKQLEEMEEFEKIQQDDHMVERCSKRDEKNEQFQGKINSLPNASTPLQEKKFPSRSARRKKAKRHWLREQAKAKDKEGQLIQNKGNHDQHFWTNGVKIQKANREDDAEAEEESLPIVVRPGHIRFEPLDEEEENHDVQDSMPLLQWNGITNKRQGQNWGKEKHSVPRLKDPACSKEPENLQYNGAEGSLNERSLNFEKLPSITGLPQEGDTIAYRLVELSSSWCPEISCFRVGEVASYDCQSGKVILKPVSEHPVVVKDSKQDDEDYAGLTNISPYNEDGSLEIDFTSLVDVCVIHHDASTTEANDNEGEKQNWSANMNAGIPVVGEPGTGEAYANEERTSKSSPQNVAEHIEGGENSSIWQEINQVFSAKKAELSLKNNQTEIQDSDAKITRSSKRSRSKRSKESDKISPESRSGGPWSFKALRGSALGPTISLLRAQEML